MRGGGGRGSMVCVWGGGWGGCVGRRLGGGVSLKLDVQGQGGGKTLGTDRQRVGVLKIRQF